MHSCMRTLFQPYPPTINCSKCWMHLSDGGAKVVTLSHHGMRASNDCLGEIAVSSNVFENISRCLSAFSCCYTPTPARVFLFYSCYHFAVHCSAQSCEMAGLVLQDAHSGNSITFFLEDPYGRFKVPDDSEEH